MSWGKTQGSREGKAEITLYMSISSLLCLMFSHIPAIICQHTHTYHSILIMHKVHWSSECSGKLSRRKPKCFLGHLSVFSRRKITGSILRHASLHAILAAFMTHRFSTVLVRLQLVTKCRSVTVTLSALGTCTPWLSFSKSLLANRPCAIALCQCFHLVLSLAPVGLSRSRWIAEHLWARLSHP